MFLRGPRKILLIHGPPRSGKTTLIERLFKNLSSLSQQFHLSGFITRELRDQGERIGFDLIFLRDESLRLPFARVESKDSSKMKDFRVGKYVVFVENLERMLEILERDLQSARLPPLIFLDEIGKMEVFSEKFIRFLEKMRSRGIPLVATIGRGEHRVLSEWGQLKEAIHIQVSQDNRNYLFERLSVEFIRTGRLIVLEGIDGAGKTTILKRLQQDSAFSHWIFSQEPTDSEYGRRLRHLLEEGVYSQRELLELFLSDREDHVKKLILPFLRAGKTIVLDRYYLSTVAYQGVEFQDLWKLLSTNETIAPLPDLVIYLELSYETAMERVSYRGNKKSLFEREDLLKRIAENYERILGLFNVLRIRSQNSLDKVYREVCSALEEWL